jgi:hypothetical protein
LFNGLSDLTACRRGRKRGIPGRIAGKRRIAGWVHRTRVIGGAADRTSGRPAGRRSRGRANRRRTRSSRRRGSRRCACRSAGCGATGLGERDRARERECAGQCKGHDFHGRFPVVETSPITMHRLWFRHARILGSLLVQIVASLQIVVSLTELRITRRRIWTDRRSAAFGLRAPAESADRLSWWERRSRESHSAHDER